jgi:transposase-like protein
MTYSPNFRERMVEKLLGPDGTSAVQLSKETGVSQTSLNRWRQQAIHGGKVSQNSSGQGPKRRRTYTSKDKIRIVMEAAALSENELGAFIRKEGLHGADLERMREEVIQAAEKGFESPKKPGSSSAEKELKQVKKELARKEKALAETAAILVLRGKLEAFLSEDEEGDTSKKKD